MKKSFLVLFSVCFAVLTFAQSTKTQWDSVNFSGIKLRSVGPAFMTGRIADLAIDPKDESHYYVGVASGGVWETKNAGTTFNPIFDGQKVYSIGCITIDPTNTSTIWVGTGENVGGRHISFGDGIYMSRNGGNTWENKGLKKSEHISKIIIHPTNSDIIWVACQGPLWNKGGDRGVYKTTNGGNDWKKVLGDSEWVGATDLLIDSRNPNILYAATWQRHRTVASYIGGGPQTAIHKSLDGGNTWVELKTGLPSGNKGKIGLAISPQNPDVIYAAIELDLRKGAVYRSDNQGANWSKMSDQISGGTGPHYYQELYACPHNFDRIYMANNYLLVSDNGGKDFRNVKNQHKHVDNHAVVFRESDPDYLMVGTDGGLFESFDLAESWKHMGNLPITQFYKLAVDDAEPFYNIYGGTQDNNTQGGPSRTDNTAGIDDNLWQIVLGGDGHQPATEPGNPNILYAQSQQGYYNRVDLITGERVSIRPQPLEGESYDRYNWDAPILVSQHNPSRVYVASHRVWKSENRGDSWSAISEDLTQNEERFDLPIMGRKQSFNSPYDVYAMSTYNTITSISESPLNQDLLYVGTDDGIIQITSNGGAKWERVNVGSLPGAPKRAYVNDIKADLFDENTVYVLLDNHKEGDFKPYVYVSKNQGKSWKSIANNLPENDYVWRLVQDHKQPNLLFVGTEFGLYFSVNGGDKWHQLKGGLPTISFRDLVIQKREDDLVAASFGRSFYVLDDISFLREINEEMLNKEASLFGLRDADLFVPRRNGRAKGSSLGGDFYAGENPEYGAVFTYYVNEEYATLKGERAKSEAKLNKEFRDINFPGWDALEEEANEKTCTYWLIIEDHEGKVLKRIKSPNGKGFHRIAWDLRSASSLPLHKGVELDKYGGNGFLVSPGNYKGQLVKMEKGTITPLSNKVSFNVTRLYEPALPDVANAEREAFYQSYLKVAGERGELQYKFNQAKKTANALEVSLLNASKKSDNYLIMLDSIQYQLVMFERKISGYKTKNEVGEKNTPTLNDRIWGAGAPTFGSIHGPTETAKQSLELAKRMLLDLTLELTRIENSIGEIVKNLELLGAPSIHGVD